MPVPQEVESEFDAALDDYMAEWEAALRAHLGAAGESPPAPQTFAEPAPAPLAPPVVHVHNHIPAALADELVRVVPGALAEKLAEDRFVQLAQQAEERAARDAERFAAFKEETTVPPVVNVHVAVPEQPAPVVHVTFQAPEQSPPVVQVAAPVVNVTVPEPPPVQVTPGASGTRRLVVERDAAGRIKGAEIKDSEP